MGNRSENSHIGWKSDVLDLAVGTESLAEHILIGLERNVADEKGVGFGVLGVTVGLGAGIGTLLWRGVVTWCREVDIGLTTINQCTLLGLESGSGVGRVGKLDVSEALGAARLAVRDDTSASDLTKLLKLAVQPLVINVPAKVANEQVLGASVLSSSLVLLDRDLLLVISLTLLGRSSLLGALLFLRLIRVIGVGRSSLGLLLLGLALRRVGIRIGLLLYIC